MPLLEGIRALEIARLIPGPYLGMLLADMGADVTKVEDTQYGDYFRTGTDGKMTRFFAWINRGKRSVAVDFRKPEGLELVYEMVKQADVIVEGARPGASDKLKIGYEHFKQVNPKIVYCSITGFGQDGPFAHLATHGGAYDAVTGLARPYQLKDGSYVQHRPYPHALTHGVWLGGMAICGALLQAQRTGKGTFLDISCSDATVMALSQEVLPILNGEMPTWPDPEENIQVKYSYYKTQDNKFMLIQALEQKFWQHFCDVVGRPDLRDRGDWSVSLMDNATNDTELRVEMLKIFASKTQAEWTEIFLKEDIAGGPYYPVEDLPNTELFKFREMIVDQLHPVVGNLRMPANAIKVPGEKFTIARPAPEQGEQTEEVLREYGFPAEKIKAWRESGLVGVQGK